MKEIIQKAIDGGWKWRENNSEYLLYLIGVRENSESDLRAITTDPLLWQAIGKACGWTSDKGDYADTTVEEWTKNHWKNIAIQFHEINLTQSWDKAVEYLSDLIKK